jgi:hypothetical protein
MDRRHVMNTDVEALKAMIRGQIPDMSPRRKLRVDDAESSYDPLLRMSAVYAVIDDWAAARLVPAEDEGPNVRAPWLYSGQHGDCIATVAHYHAREYRPGDWSSVPAEDEGRQKYDGPWEERPAIRAALDKVRPAEDEGRLLAAVHDVRMPHRQGDLHNYAWNDAVDACEKALRAALAATPEPRTYTVRGEGSDAIATWDAQAPLTIIQPAEEPHG